MGDRPSLGYQVSQGGQEGGTRRVPGTHHPSTSTRTPHYPWVPTYPVPVPGVALAAADHGRRAAGEVCGLS